MKPDMLNYLNKLLTIITLILSMIGTSIQGQTSISMSTEKGKVSINNSEKNFSIQYQGQITISEDEKDITGISRDGYLEISKSSFGSKRKIVIEPDGENGLTKEYFVGRDKVQWEPEGKNWLAEILPEILRSTLIGAEKRVDRIYAESGTSGVLTEIKQLDGDYVKSGYTQLLLAKNINTADRIKVIQTVGQEIESDHYVAEILKKNNKSFLSTPEGTTAFIAATEGVESDHYKTEILKNVIDVELNDAQMPVLIKMIGTIESDHYVTEIVKDLLKNKNLSKQNLEKIVELADFIESDHYKMEVLKSTLNSSNFNDPNFTVLLNLVNNIESDHYITEVIRGFFSYDMSEKDLMALTEIVNTKIESDHYKSVILHHMIQNQKLEGRALDLFIRGLVNIQSDHYRSDIIKKVAGTKNINSESLITLISVTKDISSDHYKANILTDIADKVKNGNDKLKNAYKEAAGTIDSEMFYDRVIKAIQ